MKFSGKMWLKDNIKSHEVFSPENTIFGAQIDNPSLFRVKDLMFYVTVLLCVTYVWSYCVLPRKIS